MGILARPNPYELLPKASSTLGAKWKGTFCDMAFARFPSQLVGERPQFATGNPKRLTPGEAFVAADRELDKAMYGPVWLKDARIAQCVVDALRFGANQLKLYELHAYVAMANHVHVLLTPHATLARITKAIKGFTAREANKILGRTGKPFWQQESFDHWVRDASEFRRIVAYIERNPVSAGLVGRAEDWPWSSARTAGRE